MTRRILRRITPGVIALGPAILVVLGLLLAWLEPATECHPGERIVGGCTPVPLASLVPILLTDFVVTFAVAFALALAARTVFRAIREAVRRIRARRASAASPPTLPAVPAAGPRGFDTARASRHRYRRTARLVLLMVAIFVAGIGADRIGLTGGAAEPADFALIREAWDLLHTEYVRPLDLDSRVLAYAAIGAMTKAVGDTDHTIFQTPEDAAVLGEVLGGSYVGLGLEFNESGAVPVVSSVVVDGPADQADIRVGDRVLRIDGRPSAGLPDHALTAALDGAAGTAVELTIERPGGDASFVVTVVRGNVTLDVVHWSMVPGSSVAVIAISLFVDGTSDQLATALAEIGRARASGIVLDLRGNPGGVFDEAVWVASEFLRSGVVVAGRDREGVVREVPVDRPVIDEATPLVVLIDGDSASASEIVSSALQDAGRATLIGRTTAGTGTGLSDYPLADGSVLTIGTVEWLTRAGRSIWHVGVVPDISVPMPDGAIPLTPPELAGLSASGLAASRDTQLLQAISFLVRQAGGG